MADASEFDQEALIDRENWAMKAIMSILFLFFPSSFSCAVDLAITGYDVPIGGKIFRIPAPEGAVRRYDMGEFVNSDKILRIVFTSRNIDPAMSIFSICELPDVADGDIAYFDYVLRIRHIRKRLRDGENPEYAIVDDSHFRFTVETDAKRRIGGNDVSLYMMESCLYVSKRILVVTAGVFYPPGTERPDVRGELERWIMRISELNVD